MITRENIEQYLNQRHVISILFFILRDNTYHLEPIERKYLKNMLKDAQRQLEFIKKNEPGCYLGSQHSTIKHLLDLRQKVIHSKNIVFDGFQSHQTKH
jgi:hypothetical protein